MHALALGQLRVQSKETHPYFSDKEKNEYKHHPCKKFDTKILLSTLWIVVMINMLKADILSLFTPGPADEVARTLASAGATIPQLMLGRK